MSACPSWKGICGYEAEEAESWQPGCGQDFGGDLVNPSSFRTQCFLRAINQPWGRTGHLAHWGLNWSNKTPPEVPITGLLSSIVESLPCCWMNRFSRALSFSLVCTWCSLDLSWMPQYLGLTVAFSGSSARAAQWIGASWVWCCILSRMSSVFSVFYIEAF